MNPMQLVLITLVFIFGAVAMVQDIRERKVSNYLSLPLFLFGLVYFLIAIPSLSILSYLALLSGVLIGFVFYFKHLWGAADGKIFIGLTLLMIAYKGSAMFSHFLVNLLLLYALVIVLFTQLFTSFKDKKKVVREIKYLERILLLLLVFIPLTIVLRTLDPAQHLYVVLLFILILFVAIVVFNDHIKKHFRGFSQTARIGIVIGMLFAFFVIANEIALFYFVLVLVAKILIMYISNLTEHLSFSKKKYQTPFAVFLFVSALITLIIEGSLIVFL